MVIRNVLLSLDYQRQMRVDSSIWLSRIIRLKPWRALGHGDVNLIRCTNISFVEMFMDFYCILIILTFIPFVVVSEGCKGINQPATTLDGGGCMCRNTDLFYMTISPNSYSECIKLSIKAFWHSKVTGTWESNVGDLPNSMWYLHVPRHKVQRYYARNNLSCWEKVGLNYWLFILLIIRVV